MGRRQGSAGEIVEGHKEHFGGDGCAHCVDCGDVFMGVYICQNLSNCTL